MTDRELLELAAKAAGMVIAWIGDVARDCTHLKKDAPMYRAPMWNPLADDGDCARMEARLGIDVRWSHYMMDTDDECVVCGHLRHDPNAFEPYGADKQAARRRASVRCAAIIGEAMP